MIEMNKEHYDAFRETLNPFEELVEWASTTYCKLRIEADLTTFDGEYWDGEIVEYNDDSITTHWEYTWSYGGSSEGECEIPLGAILGTEKDRLKYIKKLVLDEVSIVNKAKDDVDLLKLKQRKAEYNRLKREFE